MAHVDKGAEIAWVDGQRRGQRLDWDVVGPWIPAGRATGPDVEGCSVDMMRTVGPGCNGDGERLSINILIMYGASKDVGSVFCIGSHTLSHHIRSPWCCLLFWRPSMLTVSTWARPSEGACRSSAECIEHVDSWLANSVYMLMP